MKTPKLYLANAGRHTDAARSIPSDGIAQLSIPMFSDIPLRCRWAWQVVDPDGKQSHATHNKRDTLMTWADRQCGGGTSTAPVPWRTLYRRGWRCRRVLVVEWKEVKR